MAQDLVYPLRSNPPNICTHNTRLITMLITISVIIVFTMLFNVKFNAGGNIVLLEDHNMLYYSIDNKADLSRMTLDFSNVSAKVQRFTLLKEDKVCKERDILSSEDLNNFEIEMEKLEKGKYTIRITTEDNLDLVEEIEFAG